MRSYLVLIPPFFESSCGERASVQRKETAREKKAHLVLLRRRRSSNRTHLLLLTLLLVPALVLLTPTPALVLLARLLLQLLLDILNLPDPVLRITRLLLRTKLDLRRSGKTEGSGVLFEGEVVELEDRLVFLKVDRADVGDKGLQEKEGERGKGEEKRGRRTR
jgi:hypothetical protein